MAEWKLHRKSYFVLFLYLKFTKLFQIPEYLEVNMKDKLEIIISYSVTIKCRQKSFLNGDFITVFNICFKKIM